MPSTYTLISSNVLSSSAASVTFSAIPSTYTDLVIRCSARGDGAFSSESVRAVINADTGSTYSSTILRGNASAASSVRTTSVTYGLDQQWSADVANLTADTFGSTELYFPSYTVSQNKPISGFGVTENNSTSATMAVGAHLWSNTAAITSLQLKPANSSNWVSGSSFYLYGIKNS